MKKTLIFTLFFVVFAMLLAQKGQASNDSTLEIEVKNRATKGVIENIWTVVTYNKGENEYSFRHFLKPDSPEQNESAKLHYKGLRNQENVFITLIKIYVEYKEEDPCTQLKTQIVPERGLERPYYPEKYKFEILDGCILQKAS